MPFPNVPETVRRRMSKIGKKNTKPELIVRRTVHALGYRYHLHYRELPGTPDLVFPRFRKVIFVHGCFWHQHRNCPSANVPRIRHSYWLPKLEHNKMRDVKNIQQLIELGWIPLVIWECETKDVEILGDRLQRFLAGEIRSNAT